MKFKGLMICLQGAVSFAIGKPDSHQPGWSERTRKTEYPQQRSRAKNWVTTGRFTMSEGPFPNHFFSANCTCPTMTMPPEETHWDFFRYEREVVDHAWSLAQIIPGNDDALWRKDEHGAWINRQEYGNRNSQFGWEIFDPTEAGRGYGLAALRPMQWQNYLEAIAFSSGFRMTAEGLNNSRRKG
jgi:hypothetical protein